MFIGVLLVATITAVFIQVITFNRTEADVMLRVDREQWEHKLADAAAGVMQANFHLWKAKRSLSSWTADAYNGRVRASDRFRRARDRYASWLLDHPDATPCVAAATTTSSSSSSSHNTTRLRANGATESNGGTGRTSGGDVTDARKEQETHGAFAPEIGAGRGVEATVAAKVSAAIQLGLLPLREVADMQEEHYAQMQQVTAHVRSLLHVQQRMVLLQEQMDANTLALIQGTLDREAGGSRGEADEHLSDSEEGAASSLDGIDGRAPHAHEMHGPRSVSVTLARNPHLSGGRGV